MRQLAEFNRGMPPELGCGSVMLEYKVFPAGDTALVVEFGDRIDRKLSTIVLSLAQALDAACIEGVVETVPTFRSLMIHYEPITIPALSLKARIDEQLQSLKLAKFVRRHWQLPVCYDRCFAVDLDDVAKRTALSRQQVIDRHSGPMYHVYMLGFLPGQAYMGDVPAEMALGRREVPRTKVPAGTVAIASTMSCVFPLETPCGWHVIGRCPTPLWDHEKASALIAPGDSVGFVPVSLQEYDTLVTRALAGDFRLEPESECLGASR